MDVFKFLFFGHYDFTNPDTGKEYHGWSFWFLPSYTDSSGYGYRPEKWNLSEQEFSDLGGVEYFKKLLGKDVNVILRPRGKYIRFCGMSEYKH